MRIRSNIQKEIRNNNNNKRKQKNDITILFQKINGYLWEKISVTFGSFPFVHMFNWSTFHFSHYTHARNEHINSHTHTHTQLRERTSVCVANIAECAILLWAHAKTHDMHDGRAYRRRLAAADIHIACAWALMLMLLLLPLTHIGWDGFKVIFPFAMKRCRQMQPRYFQSDLQSTLELNFKWQITIFEWRISGWKRENTTFLII